MKTKLIIIVLLMLAGLWFLNKVRIVVFASMGWVIFWLIVVGGCAWLLTGGIGKIPPFKGFIDKYGGDKK